MILFKRINYIHHFKGQVTPSEEKLSSDTTPGLLLYCVGPVCSVQLCPALDQEYNIEVCTYQPKDEKKMVGSIGPLPYKS